MYKVYLISTSETPYKYVGCTRNLPSRKRSHKSRSKCNKYGWPLYDDILKYGWECFSFETISEHPTEEEGFASEVALIASMREANTPLYNIAEGGRAGFPVLTEEVRGKLRKARAGKKPALGMKHTEENKQYAKYVSRKYWDTQETYDPEEVVKMSFKDAKDKHGISKTHYYRLRKRVETNDLN